MSETTAEAASETTEQASEETTTEAETTAGKTFDEAYVSKLRAEAAENRTKARDAEAKAKADADEKINKVLTALGIKAEEDDDPTKAAEQAARERDEARADTNRTRLELAIYKTAGKAGADPDTLLDSTSFLRSVADIDPTDTEAIQQAITKAVEQNQRFKLARVAGQSGADFSGGSGEGAITQDKFNVMTPAEKNALFKSDPTLYRRLAG